MINPIRLAILDLYEGQPNQGMRCLREIIAQWSLETGREVETDEFDVRSKEQVPGPEYHIYLSSGGPGSPLDSTGSDWEKAYFHWLSGIENWNNNPENVLKKHVFFICHSFELVCRHYAVAQVTKRKSRAFGVFPVHLTPAGQSEKVFKDLCDPFYVVDSRDWQVIQPNYHKMDMMGAQVLCIEKERPHVPLERAIMGIRFSEYMVGTQFHPEADAVGMGVHLNSDEQKQNLIHHYGEAKWQSILEGLQDPGKIMHTYNRILPNFLNRAAGHLPAL